jgi:pyruvate/2-oxoglutarate dehydrogenase complex dihydrolipoamide acyltransferase (E2) component
MFPRKHADAREPLIEPITDRELEVLQLIAALPGTPGSDGKIVRLERLTIMSKIQAVHRVVPLPRMRQVYIDTLHLGHRKHTVHALIEADVTEARRIIAEHKARTGETLSFTAFVLGCLGRAVDGNRYMHAFRNWRNQLVLFDEVDVTTMFEVQAGDERFPVAHVIRAVNKRPFREIHDEIRSYQTARQRQPNPYERLLPLYTLVPGPIRRLVWRAFFRCPHLAKQSMGTTILTAVGMFGEGGGWGITMPLYTLGVTLGGIVQRPALIGDRIEGREYLCITLGFDHDIVDGAPAARFAQHFKQALESGYGLD